MSSSPASTGSGESDFVSERSAAGLTVVSALAALSAVSGSAVMPRTFALLVSVPGACGVTLISTSTVASSAIVPSEQSTVPPDLKQLPWRGGGGSKVTPAGRVSLSATPVVLDGPALWTVRV